MSKLATVFKILRRDSNPLRRIFKLVVMKLPFDVGGHLGLKIQVQDFHIRLHPSQITLPHWCDPNARLSDYRFITSYLKPGQTYIDVGANIGTTVIPAARAVGESGKVIGFEPQPTIFSYLHDNVALNKLWSHVEIHNCALGHERGYVEMSADLLDDRNRVMTGRKSIKVPIKLLDDFGQQYSEVDLLKIDVEGYEKFVCDGGIKTIEKTHCIYFEIGDEHCERYGYTMKHFLTWLSHVGFDLFVVTDQKALMKICPDYKLPARRGHVNAFAIRDIEEFASRTS